MIEFQPCQHQVLKAIPAFAVQFRTVDSSAIVPVTTVHANIDLYIHVYNKEDNPKYVI
jgi:hypothetical protein